MDYFKDVVNAIDFIETHLKEDISVSHVSAITGLSSWHFQRVFRDFVGETIGSYLRRRRLACALEEIQTSDRKIIDIALAYQFESSEGFSRAFKVEFGISPQNFRVSQILISPFKKPRLEKKQIQYINEQLELNPVIREVEPISVIGLRSHFVSPLAQRHKYLETVTQVWKDLVQRESEITHRLHGVKVGVIEGMVSNIHDDMMSYIAAVPVTQTSKLPEEFVSFIIPGGTYAVFTATGFHEQTQYIIDHVYSNWLPQSDYRRSEGPEFTWLDHRIKPLNALTSEVEYYLPVY